MSKSSEQVNPDEALHELLEFLGKGDLSSVKGSLEKLGIGQTSQIFERTCQMAVQLHDSLMNFQKSLSNGSVTMNSTTIPDAADKLENVIKMTFDAANTTIDELEKQLHVLETSNEAIEKSLTKISGDENLADESKKELVSLLTQTQGNLDQAISMNFKVIQAQEFQDLTGQALRKVIKLVQELEVGLVSIVKLFGIGFNKNADGQDETVVIESETKIDQDSVDDILKSFD